MLIAVLGLVLGSLIAVAHNTTGDIIVGSLIAGGSLVFILTNAVSGGRC